MVACRWPGAISASLVFTAIGLNSGNPQELTAHVWRLGILDIKVFDNRAAATSSVYDAAHLSVLGIQVAYPESCAQGALRVLRRSDESHMLDLATVAGASKFFRLLRSTSDIIRVKYYSSMPGRRIDPNSVDLNKKRFFVGVPAPYPTLAPVCWCPVRLLAFKAWPIALACRAVSWGKG